MYYSIVVNRPTVDRKKILPGATTTDRGTTSGGVVGVARVNLVSTSATTQDRRTFLPTRPRHEDPPRKTASAARPPRPANRRSRGHGPLEFHRRRKINDNGAVTQKSNFLFLHDPCRQISIILLSLIA